MNVSTKRSGQTHDWLRRPVVHVVLVSCVVLGLRHGTGLGQDSVPAVADRANIQLRGTVVDAAGQPVGGARVTLVAPILMMRDSFWLENMVPRATIDVDTSSAGAFHLAFPRTDTRFLAKGDFGLVIYHPDHQIRFDKFPIARLQSDWPMTVSLAAAHGVRVHVCDTHGAPLAATKVTIAEQGAVTIPYATMGRLGVVTDQQGWVTLRNADRDRLQSIYVQSNLLGCQKLTVQATNEEEFQTQSMPVTSVQGQFRCDGGQAVPGMDRLEIVVGSRPRTDVWDSPRDYSWARVTVDASGKFAIPAISEGTCLHLVHYPDDFPYRHTYGETTHVSGSDAPQTWSISLTEAVRIRGKILQQESSEAVAHICVDCGLREDRGSFSDEQGQWSFWLARGDTCDYWPQPALGEFTYSGIVYRRVAAQSQSGEQQIEPLYMRRASSARGIARDEQGRPVAGAVILCERKVAEYWLPITSYAHADGTFPLTGVSDGEAIRLSARSGIRATEKTVSLTVTSTMNPELILVPHLAAQLSGRVVDAHGTPVAGATVLAQKKVVLREEGGSSEFAKAEDLLPDGSFVRTDAQGEFCFPPTIDWQRLFQIRITHQDYTSFCTPWIDGRKLQVANERIPLDECRLLCRPETAQATVSVVDAETGQGIPGAKVVLLGARTGKASGVTDEHGGLTLTTKNGRQVVAVAKDGYGLLFQDVASLEGLLRLPLRGRTSGAVAPRDAVTRFTVPQLQSVGKQLLGLVPAPRAGDSSINRLYLYYRSLATVSPTEAVKTLSAPDAGIPFQDTALSLCASVIIDVDRSLAAQLAVSTADQESRSYQRIALARREQDPDVRADHISEALIAARQLAGREYLSAMASVALLLWETGAGEDARDVLREAWEKSPQMQTMVANGQRIPLPAQSRSFATAMALIDPDTSVKLINLMADPNEIKSLQTEILTLVADSDPERFTQMIAEFGYDNLASHQVRWFVDGYGVRNVALIADLVRKLPDSMEKAETLVALARRAQELLDDSARDLCGEALQVLYRLDLSHAEENAFSHYSARTAALVTDMSLVSPELVPDYLFASIWLWTGVHGEGNDFQLIGAVASGLAHLDPALARVLVEPCFEECSWLCDETHPSAYVRCGTLKAAVRTDPVWAADIVRGILATTLAGDDMRRTELVCGVVDELRAMIVDLDRQVQPGEPH